ARRTALRLHRAFQKQGRTSPWDDEHAFVDSGDADPFRLEEPGLFACYQAAASGVAVSAQSAGQPLLRLLVNTPAGPARPSDAQREDEPVAETLGINVYAKQLVDGRDRKQLERLCRYVMRPPLSQERLEWRADGRLELTLKNVWKDGTRALVLEPFDLLVRLCSAIPPAWFHSGTAPTWTLAVFAVDPCVGSRQPRHKVTSPGCSPSMGSRRSLLPTACARA